MRVAVPRPVGRVPEPEPGRTRQPGDRRRELGDLGEDLAAAWYRAAGYDVLDRNWRRREGELDLVVHRDRVLVFCEVKTRRDDGFGAPAEAVTHEKRRRVRALAAAWLAEHKPIVREVRFDVASVAPGADGTLRVEVIESAF